MGGLIRNCVAIALILALAFPFGREAYRRYELAHNLNSIMDERDRTAFQYYNGDARSFGKQLLERCELTNGSGSQACDRYRFALR